MNTTNTRSRTLVIVLIVAISIIILETTVILLLKNTNEEKSGVVSTKAQVDFDSFSPSVISAEQMKRIQSKCGAPEVGEICNKDFFDAYLTSLDSRITDLEKANK